MEPQVFSIEGKAQRNSEFNETVQNVSISMSNFIQALQLIVQIVDSGRFAGNDV